MRICVDIQPAVAQRAGVGRYTKQLVEHLGEFAGTDAIRLFYFDFKRRGVPFHAPQTAGIPFRWLPGRIVQQSWKRLQWPPFDWLAGRADLYHFPNFTIPPVSAGRTIVTIHDMSFMRHPQFAEQKNLSYLASTIHRTAARADAILTDSRFSAAEIADCLKVDPSRIFAVHLGVSPECRRAGPAEVSSLRQRHGLERPYLLTVGTVEPRKNLDFMIEVFNRLTDFDGDLVIAGMRGWKYEPVLRKMRDSPRSSRIRYLEYVDDRELPALYSGAELFLITSFYEGFGFPPLEAMACGIPVVSSTGGSLAEVLRGNAVILDSFDPDAWVQAVGGLLSDDATRASMAQAGPGHAAQYDWRNTARETFNIYRKVLS